MTKTRDLADLGVGTIKFADGTNRDNAAMMKLYVGTTAVYIPYFLAG